MADGWTARDLRERLGQVGVVPELVVPVRVTGVDLDPSTAQDHAGHQRPAPAAAVPRGPERRRGPGPHRSPGPAPPAPAPPRPARGAPASPALSIRPPW